MANVIEFTIRGIDRASGPLGSVSKTAGNLAAGAAKMAAAAAAAAGAVIGFTVAVNKSIDATAKFATRIGVSVEALSKMQFVANQASISTEQFNMAVQRMTRRVGEAAQGTGEARQALVDLGIDAKKFQDLGVDEQLGIIADKMQNVQGSANQLRLAFKLFDSEGTSVLQMLKNGSGAMQDMAKDAEFLGVVISKQAAANAQELSNAMGRAEASLKGVSRGIAGELTPLLTGLANSFANFVANARPAIIAFVKDTLQGAATIGVVLGQVYSSVKQFIGSVFTIEGFQKFVDNAKAAMAAVSEIFLRAAPVLFGAFVKSFQLMWQSFVESAKWAWLSVLDFFRGTDKAGTLADLLFKDIPAATEQTRTELATMFDAIGVITTDTGEQVSNALLQTFGINIDLARQQAADMISQMEQFGQIVEEKQDQALTRGKDFTQALHDINADFIATQKQVAEELAASLHDTLMGTIDAVSQGIAGVIVSGGNMLEVLKNIANQALQQVLAVLIKMGIQRLALWAIDKLTTVATSQQKLATGMAEVYTNSFASAAAIPIIGWQIAPGVASANLAAAIGGAAAAGAAGGAVGTSIAGVAHGGLTNVPAEGTYLLNGNERVLSPRQNQDLTEFLSSGGATGLNIESLSIEVLPNATNADAFLSLTSEEIAEIVARKLYPAFDSLARSGVRPQYLTG